jgi:hypothetical protein
MGIIIRSKKLIDMLLAVYLQSRYCDEFLQAKISNTGRKSYIDFT